MVKNCFVPEADLGSCLRRNDKLRGLNFHIQRLYKIIQFIGFYTFFKFLHQTELTLA